MANDGEASWTPEDLARDREAARERSQEAEKAIGRRLRAIRGDRMSRRQVVETLEEEHGIKMLNSTLAAIEAGERGVRLIEAVALAEIYGVELTAFTQDHVHQSAEGVARVRISELDTMRRWIDERVEDLRTEIGE